MTQKNNQDKKISSECIKTQHRIDLTICHVRLRPGSTPVTYAAKDIPVKEGEWVLIPTEHGQEVGQIVKNPIRVGLLSEHLPPFVERLATTREIEDYYKNLDLERQGRNICQRLIDSLGLKMKLIKVERFFDGSKIIFYYSADGRVDFRELVKELVKELRIRVEMRQIGIRHEAKLIGGIGCCGRELCCASFLCGFDPISIKMAKVQNLPLNPNKISGSCGRLLCCLTYEYETYKEMAHDLPGVGKSCETPEGHGKVVRHNIFKQAVIIAMPDGTFVEYTIDELESRDKDISLQDKPPSEQKAFEKTQAKNQVQKKSSHNSPKKIDHTAIKKERDKNKEIDSKSQNKGNYRQKTRNQKASRKKQTKKKIQQRKKQSRANSNKKGKTPKS